ncbi:MAG: hypothetical protein ACI4M9_02975, partial [Succinivibrio sp.]
MRDKLLALTFLAATLASAPAVAVMHSGWQISPAYIWRLVDNSDYRFTAGSPAKILELDRTIRHRQAVFKVQRSITGKYTFKTGCMYQSATPSFELDVSSLDIAINDNFRGFVFARFLVDNGQEYSLRGQILPPSRIVFAPITRSQDKKISDLYLQLNEGGKLQIALLQGPTAKPRVYTIPLEGFFELSDKVLKDCVYLSGVARNHRGDVELLPDYITKEPEDAAPEDYTLKPSNPTDGLTPNQADAEPEPMVETPKPEVQPFTPGGSKASIG